MWILRTGMPIYSRVHSCAPMQLHTVQAIMQFLTTPLTQA